MGEEGPETALACIEMAFFGLQKWTGNSTQIFAFFTFTNKGRIPRNHEDFYDLGLVLYDLGAQNGEGPETALA